MMSTTEADLEVDVSHEKEDGELEDSDVEEGTYIPLQRPEGFNPPSLGSLQIEDEQSDEPTASESSGSESDAGPRPKRTRLRPRPQPQGPHDQKKYKVWCKALQEDILIEDMISCDVSKKSRYGVESYDYTIKYRLDDEYAKNKVFSSTDNREAQSNKRQHGERGNVKLRLGKRVNSNQKLDERHEARILEDLTKTDEDPAIDLAKDIAEKLSEEKVDLLENIVSTLGASKAIELYKETQRIEADGGMLVMSGSRRRTAGGVYLFLLKRDAAAPAAAVARVFSAERRRGARHRRTRQRVVEQLKQSLTDSELPSLLSRGEAAAAASGSDPPPSPATDAREGSSSPPSPASPAPHAAPVGAPAAPAHARPLHTYEDDDFLEVMCNEDMDMF